MASSALLTPAAEARSSPLNGGSPRQGSAVIQQSSLYASSCAVADGPLLQPFLAPVLRGHITGAMLTSQQPFLCTVKSTASVVAFDSVQSIAWVVENYLTSLRYL